MENAVITNRLFEIFLIIAGLEWKTFNQPLTLTMYISLGYFST